MLYRLGNTIESIDLGRVARYDSFMMNKNLLEILACPLCKSKLIYQKSQSELICKIDGLAYPIIDDIPIMLEENARKLTLSELDKVK